MSSYVGNSFCNQTHDAPSFSMRTFGNYGAVSEFQQSTYAYGGLDLSGALASQVVSESPKREAMNKHNSARINAAPHRQACAAMGSPSRVNTRGYNLLSHGLLSQKAEMIMEVTEKPIGKSQPGDMEITPTIKQQTNSSELQTQSQPQIYPWMTKLHISHGKVASNVLGRFFGLFFNDNNKSAHLIFSSFHSMPVCSFHTFFLEFYRPKTGNNKTHGRKFYNKGTYCS